MVTEVTSVVPAGTYLDKKKKKKKKTKKTQIKQGCDALTCQLSLSIDTRKGILAR